MRTPNINYRFFKKGGKISALKTLLSTLLNRHKDKGNYGQCKYLYQYFTKYFIKTLFPPETANFTQPAAPK
jgi:hypothetical protein